MSESSFETNQIVQRGIFYNMIQDMLFSMCQSFLNRVDVQINGNEKSDIKVNNEEFYYQLFKFLSGIDRAALGESYMDGYWDTDLLAFFEKCFQTRKTISKSSKYLAKMLQSLPVLFVNLQTKFQSKKDISFHYDSGNDLFKLMLDRSMNYSCGYWQKNISLNPSNDNINSICETLDEAQMNKMLLIGRKLNLEPGMRCLDVGCGWGYLAKFLAINFDVHVVGITISKEQYEYATTIDLESKDLDFLRIQGLNPKGTGKFQFKFIDYRDVNETFDRIVSVGMFEHVGIKNYDQYFEIARDCLKQDGLFLLHSIGIYNHYIPQDDAWLNKYIFPGGIIPKHTQMIQAFNRRFVVEDWHNMGYCYYRTLVSWHTNFIKNWPKLESRYGERFKRMWEYYLLYCAALFKTRKIALWQIVLSRDGFPNGYRSFR